MKKLLVAIVMAFFLTGCSGSSLKSISYNEFKEKIENKETFVAYISRTGCSHCEAYEPTLRKVLSDYKLTAYKINLADLSSTEEKSVSKKVGLEGTPTLIYIEKGKADIDGSLVGETTYENTEDFFRSIGYIEG